MDLIKVEKILKEEPFYRLKQIKKAVFSDLIEDWNQATTFPRNLREKLSKNCPIKELREEKTLISKDKQTVKILFKLKEGSLIESVLMKHIDGRRTVCVSSQIGCKIGCKFCATGQKGFKRDLTTSEIIDQVLFFARLLKKDRSSFASASADSASVTKATSAKEAASVNKKATESKRKVTNIVFMGMGEPFLNYDNVLGAIKVLNDKDGFNLGARHISISTAGITEGIEKLTIEPLQINLAISLHAPNNELRSKLMPINKIYSIEKILKAVDNYIKKTGRRVMFEYLMIDGVNDSPIQAEELAKLLKKPLHFVNLISFNPIGHSEFKPSSGWKIKQFKEILIKAGINVTQRYRFGKEIKAACGQLAGTSSEALAKEGGQLAGVNNYGR